MPELPEVEAIRQVLEPQVQGLTIQDIGVHRPEIIAHPSAGEFCGRLMGQTFDRAERRGKFLLFWFESGDHMVLHLRMTGCLLVTPGDMPEEKHTHLVFRLSNGRELRFSDTRRFGRFWLIANGEADPYSGIEKLGVEPLASECSAEYLRDRLGKRKKAIKECLLDQSIVAGIGNIYSDEILFAAKIHPARLAAAIPQQLAYFIEKNQMTPEEYLETKGQDYRNTPFLQVYGCEGKPCSICGELLCRMVIGGRGSTYCPTC